MSIHADGGGKRSAAQKPVFGFAQVMKVHKALAELFRRHGSELVHLGFINGLPGFVTREVDGRNRDRIQGSSSMLFQTTALDIEDGRVVAVYVMRNPDKLRHLH